MSHHLDSPLSRQDTRLNITDQYLFDGLDTTVMVMNSRSSLAGPQEPAGFHPEAQYQFNLQRSEQDADNLAYRLAFEPTVADGTQTFTVRRLVGPADDAAGGDVVAQGLTGEVVTSGGFKVWAGRALDPFYLDLSLLAAVNAAVQRGERVRFDDRRPDESVNSFAGSSVSTIVVELAHSVQDLSPGSRVSLWSSTRLATDAGGWGQVNRAGLPMIWPIFRPDGSDGASEANTTRPEDDRVSYGKSIADLVSAVVLQHGTARDPAAYGEAVAARLTPDVLPYTIGSPASFGFSGFNGRTLSDNAPEVMFSLVTNRAIPTGLTSRTAAGTHTGSFPYVVPVAA